MKIIEITRTISGYNYDNLSMKAVLTDEDNPTEVGLNLDRELNKILDKIRNSALEKAVDKTESEKRTIREKEDYYLGKIVTPKSK